MIDEKILKEVIAEANNSLYGSQSFFLTTKDDKVVGAVGVTGEPDKYHLAKQIERVKMSANKNHARAQQLESLLCEAREVIRKIGGGDALLEQINELVP